MKNAYTGFSTIHTLQSEPIPGRNMVRNNAGGYGFAVDDWVRLDRFLVLGSEGGTYYVGERELTAQNAEAVIRCIQANGRRVVNRIVEISDAGRAPKNDPALFVLALCASPKFSDLATRQAAFAALPHVARIGIHLFHFVQYARQFRGGGRAFRDALAAWYNDKSADQLAYQMMKYRQRDGWTHHDVLHIARPVPVDTAHCELYRWAKDKTLGDALPDIVAAFATAQTVDKKQEVIRLIANYNLTREMIPTQWLTDPDVWAALLDKMPLTAMIRNLGNMSKVGLLKAGNWDAINAVTGRLTDQDYLRKARVHPLSILAALNTYSSGKSFRGSGEWDVVPQVVDALDTAFYLSFGTLERINKNVMLALDVSGSMTFGNIAGVGGITPRVGSAAMALVTANICNHIFTAFSNGIVPIKISPRQRLDDVCKTVDNMRFSSTDCAQPMLYAIRNNIKDLDAFIVYTDSETWYGDIHPVQALDQYRRKFNYPAKLVVVGMVSNEFSIADSNDAGMLDVVGFDTATPNVISDFISG